MIAEIEPIIIVFPAWGKRVTLTPEQAAKVWSAVNRGFARSAEECINRAFDLFLAEHGHPENSDGSR